MIGNPAEINRITVKNKINPLLHEFFRSFSGHSQDRLFSSTDS